MWQSLHSKISIKYHTHTYDGIMTFKGLGLESLEQVADLNKNGLNFIQNMWDFENNQLFATRGIVRIFKVDQKGV
jgi:hypothetical protein